MDSEKKEYGLIIKSLSILGSAQVVSLIIALLRSKVIAVFLGPVGMGIAGLFNTTIDVFSSVTSLGLDKSGVKEISFIRENSEADSYKQVISLLKRLSMYTAIVGAFLMLCFSYSLSYIVFKSYDYVGAFMWLALALLFKQLSQVNLAILQGLRVVKLLAKANMYGSVIGLVFSFPMYYYLGIKAIVPAIIITNLIAFFISSFYQKKQYKIQKEDSSIFQVFIKGKDLLKLGVLLNFTSIVSLVATYGFQIYLTSVSSLEIVGFYLAGIAILNYSVNIVFNAMSMDYYPRLAAVHNSNNKLRGVIEKQSIIALLIITPIIISFSVFSPLFVKILYSSKFLDILVFVKWAIFGMFFKAISWSVGYSFIAKGDSKVFLKTTIIFNLLFFCLNIVGFNLLGLQGLGVSFFVYYALHLIAVYFIANKRYKFYYNQAFYKMFTGALILCVCALICDFTMEKSIFKYVLQALLVLLSFVFALYFLDKKVNLKTLFKIR